MIVLKATTEILEVTTSATAALDYSVTFVDITTSAFAPSSNEGKITTATTTTIVSAPAASTQRQIKYLSIRNIDASVSNTISIKKDISGTEYKLTSEIILLAGESYCYIDGLGWQYFGADGSVKNAAVAAAPNNSYRAILDVTGSHTAAKAAGTYAMGQGDPLAVSGTGTLYPLNTLYIAAADYPTIYGFTTKLRLRAHLYVNDVAPTGNFTFGLYPITRPATSGGAGVCIFTLGVVVANSTVLFTTPAADSSNVGVSADFPLPSDGHYVIGVVTTATVAASSHLHLSAILQMRNA